MHAEILMTELLLLELWRVGIASTPCARAFSYLLLIHPACQMASNFFRNTMLIPIGSIHHNAFDENRHKICDKIKIKICVKIKNMCKK